MCGIIYVQSKKKTVSKILKQYNNQKTRGTEGFGYVAFNNGMITKYKRYSNERDTLHCLKTCKASNILFHHRYPTSTENVPETAHPIKIEHDELKFDYYVTHNGVISNPTSLYSKHEKLGYQYTTTLATKYVTANGDVYNGEFQFNDSESLAIELARNIELGTKIEATGSIAFILLQVSKGGKKVHNVMFGTNGGNPLTMTNNGNTIMISSEDGQSDVSAMVMHTLNTKTNAITYTKLDVTPYITHHPTSYGYSAKYQSFIEYPDTLSDEVKIVELEEKLEKLEYDIQVYQKMGDSEDLQDAIEERNEIEIDLMNLYNKSYDYTEF